MDYGYFKSSTDWLGLVQYLGPFLIPLAAGYFFCYIAFKEDKNKIRKNNLEKSIN
jgi:hypothetical protein